MSNDIRTFTESFYQKISANYDVLNKKIDNNNSTILKKLNEKNRNLDDKDVKFDNFVLNFQTLKNEKRENMAMILTLLQKFQENSGSMIKLPHTTPFQSANTDVSSLFQLTTLL